MSRRRPAPGDREPPSRSTGPKSRQALPGHDPRRCSLQPRRSRSTRRLQPAPPSHTEDQQNPRTSLVRPPLPSEAVVLAGAVVAPAADEEQVRSVWVLLLDEGSADESAAGFPPKPVAARCLLQVEKQERRAGPTIAGRQLRFVRG